jgi:heterodisulfide reductase subunit C
VELETIKLKDCDPNFAKEVIEAGGKKANVCFQCGTCTAGCPTVYAMDHTPRQIMRMVNLGMREQVLKSGTIWVCASCFTCQSRCPRGVEITAVMSALKSIAIKEGIDVANKKGPTFHDSFIEDIMSRGRVFEPMFILKFMSRSEGSIPGVVRALANEATLGMEMVRRGKLAFLPHNIGKPEQLKIICGNIRKMEESK